MRMTITGVALVLVLNVAAEPKVEQPIPAVAVARAATSFVATLDQSQRAEVSVDFNDEKRLTWSFFVVSSK